MIKVKLFPQPGTGALGFEKMCNKWEENINEWLKQQIDVDIIDIRPGFVPSYSYILVYYKIG